MSRVLGMLFAFAVLLAGASSPLAQTPPPAGQKAPKRDDTKMAPQTAVGTVKAMMADSVVVGGKVKGQDVEWTFALDATTKVRKDGQDVTGAELRPGDPVRVRYVEQEGKSIAQHIAVTTPVKAKTDKAPAQKK